MIWLYAYLIVGGIYGSGATLRALADTKNPSEHPWLAIVVGFIGATLIVGILWPVFLVARLLR